MKLVVLTDIHFSYQTTIPERQSNIADILLLRAVHRINRYIKPDAVVVLGDVINELNSPQALEQYRQLRKILNILQMPYIIIPGNHDLEADRFYSVFEVPAEVIDIAGVRLVPFIDPDQPGYNAVRQEKNLERMKRARGDFKGPVIALQHVPIFPPGTIDCPYNYTNADEVLSLMQKYKIDLAISGHFHNGFDLLRSRYGAFITVGALCEHPFRFAELDITNTDDINVTRHQLAMPKDLELIDHHIHTHLAYCNENMDIRKSKMLADVFGLTDVRFSEHSSHLYFDRPTYNKAMFFKKGISSAKDELIRIESYFNLLKEADCPDECIGLEVDCDCKGNPVIRPQDLSRTGFLIGAVHILSSSDLSEMKEEFIYLHEKFLTCGIKILAHPFRVFRRANQPTPSELFAPLVDLLKKNNVAAEINFHTNYPPVDFVRMCIEADVKLSLGSDAHNLYEIGEFYPHLDLLSECGISPSELKNILIT